MITVIVTGGFDPIHSGHISYLKSASLEDPEGGTRLIVGLNSDSWLERKKGQAFMPWEERASIIRELSCVDEVIAFNDDDNTAIDAIRIVKEKYPNDKIVFANGGDRTKDNIPEMIFDDVEFIFGVGGTDKKNSSSWILKEWSQPSVERKWGTYRVLDKNCNWSVKELTFREGESLSNQRHFHRSEHWHVVSGKIHILLEYETGEKAWRSYSTGDSVDIPKRTWHKATNVGIGDATIIEVWLGDNLTEEDIERRD